MKLIVKLVLLGNPGVGKTSIKERIVYNKFEEYNEPTIGAMFSSCTLPYNDSQLTFEIWDTAGNDKFKPLTPLYYRNATAALVVYDITDKKSYIDALQWINELKEYDTNIVIGLCGNKLDLDEYRTVQHQIPTDLVNVFYETSAKTNVNITPMFRKIGSIIINKPIKPKNNGFQLMTIDDPPSFYCC